MPSLLPIPQAAGIQNQRALEKIRPDYGRSQGLGDPRYSGTVRGGLPPGGCRWRPGLGAAPHCMSLPAVQRLREPLLCGGLYPGKTGFPASDRSRHRTHRVPLVGALRDVFREQMNQAINRPLPGKPRQRLFCTQQRTETPPVSPCEGLCTGFPSKLGKYPDQPKKGPCGPRVRNQANGSLPEKPSGFCPPEKDPDQGDKEGVKEKQVKGCGSVNRPTPGSQRPAEPVA